LVSQSELYRRNIDDCPQSRPLGKAGWLPHHQEKREQRAASAGVTAYLAKVLQPDRLLASIEAAIAGGATASGSKPVLRGDDG
jgi:hypothetical protein